MEIVSGRNRVLCVTVSPGVVGRNRRPTESGRPLMVRLPTRFGRPSLGSPREGHCITVCAGVAVCSGRKGRRNQVTVCPRNIVADRGGVSWTSVDRIGSRRALSGLPPAALAEGTREIWCGQNDGPSALATFKQPSTTMYEFRGIRTNRRRPQRVPEASAHVHERVGFGGFTSHRPTASCLSLSGASCPTDRLDSVASLSSPSCLVLAQLKDRI